jgi:diguanylate cyclase (GGDEF)-like protein
MGASVPTTPRERLRGAFARENQFAGADIELARRFTRIGWILGCVVAYVLFPLYPPTHVLGDAGWLVTPGATSFAVAGWMYFSLKHPERVTFNVLLVTSYMGIVMVGLGQWLAGGLPAPYHELYPFMICGAAAVHPPRRFIPFMVFTAAVIVVPELGRTSGGQMGDLITELLLWLGASLFVLAIMLRLRQHRADLRADEAEARELARVDPLTRLGNRRAFEEVLETEIARSRRAGTPLSLLVCDLDDFKEINDRHGHLAGDDCLQRAADTLKAKLRTGDTAFRWGGDEFVVILPGTAGRGTSEVCRRMESAVEQACSRPDGTPLHITTGRAELHGEMTGQELLATADLSLRERKQGSDERDPSASSV